MPYAPGRPLLLASKVTVKDKDGADVKVRVLDAICAEIERTGLRPSLCGEVVGCDRSTIYGWLKEGHRLVKLREQRRADFPWSRRERLILEFLDRTQVAKARWVAEMAALHASVARGDLLVSEITEKIDGSGPEGSPPRVLERSVKRRRTLPDARALEWQLERLAKEEGLGPRIEVTGADGGPLEVEAARPMAERLLGEIDAWEQGVRDAQERAAELAGQEEANGARQPSEA